MKGSLSWSEVLNSILFTKRKEKANVHFHFLLLIIGLRSWCSSWFIYAKKEKEKRSSHFTPTMIPLQQKPKKKNDGVGLFHCRNLEMVIQEMRWLAYHKISLAWGISSNLKKLIITRLPASLPYLVQGLCVSLMRFTYCKSPK